MEFDEKLQQLRKEKGWTQEQLAEKLYVSRTAISKWENGKGYPNIESLKSIASLFSVSIDELLSGDALLSLAEDENRSNLSRLTTLQYGILDVMVLMLLFLPLYSRQDSDIIRTVSLFSSPDTNAITMGVFILFPILMAGLGIVQILRTDVINKKPYNRSKTISILLHSFAVLVYVLTNQPYATAILFLLFIGKVVLIVKENIIKK